MIMRDAGTCALQPSNVPSIVFGTQVSVPGSEIKATEDHSLSTSFDHITLCSVSYICWYVFLSAHSWCIYVAHCIVYKVLSSFFFSFPFLFFLFLISSY